MSAHPNLLPGTLLQRDAVAPGVTLADPRTGRAVSTSDFRHRRALVLCFVHSGCARCDQFLVEVAGRADDFRISESEARAVVTEPGEHAVPVLVDPKREAHQRFLGPDGEVPVVVILDRYGAAWRSYPAQGHDFPAASEIADTLWHLATMCPECGVAIKGWAD